MRADLAPPPISLADLPDRVRLPLAFDAGRMAAEAAQFAAADWTAHFVAQNYEGGWSILPLRCKAGATHPIMMAVSDPTATAFDETPWLARSPYLCEVLAAFPCPLLTVRLMRLDPGARIKPHCDPDLDAAQGDARLHVPITTNPAVDFRLNGTRVVMQPGEAWYVRLSDTHSIDNRGTTARIHLVIDCKVGDAFAAMLAAAAQAVKQPTSTIPEGKG
jgi:quercetin dioxygenase-like cupin family protein